MIEDNKVMPEESEVANLSGHGGKSLVMMAHGAQSLGDLTRARKTIEGGHKYPDGCQWSRRCEECPWTDCVIHVNRHDYDSKEARQIRLDNIGKGQPEIRTRSRMPMQLVSNINRRRMLIAEAREAGIPEQSIADAFHVSARTVRRSVEWAEGLHDKPWGRHR